MFIITWINIKTKRFKVQYVQKTILKKWQFTACMCKGNVYMFIQNINNNC